MGRCAGFVLLALVAAVHAEPEEVPKPASLDELVKRLDDPRHRDDAAVEVLRRRPGDARALRLVIAQLRHDEWYTRWRACLALAKAGDHARPAAAELLAAATDAERDIAHEARLALRRIGSDDPRVVHFWFLEAKRTGWTAVPGVAVSKVERWRRAYEAMHDKGPAPSIARLFALRDYGLSDRGVLRALHSPDPTVVQHALEEVCERKHLDPRAYYPPVFALCHGTHAHKRMARTILADRHRDRFKVLFTSPGGRREAYLLLDNWSPVRRVAGVLLLPYVDRTRRAERRLLEALAFDPDERVRDAALQGLFTRANLFAPKTEKK